MNKIAKFLNQHIVGNVFTDDAVLEGYATDKSILKIKPKMVVLPECTNDIRKVLKLANQMAEKGSKLGVTIRGFGNDKTGAAIGDGIVIDLSRRMDKILEIDIRQRLVRLQPGVTIGELNTALALHGMELPVVPRYQGHTIGGMIANNLQGETKGGEGTLMDCMRQMEIVLANGDVLQTERMGKRELHKRKGWQTLEGEIFRKLDNLIDDRKDVIEELLAGEDMDNVGYEAISLVRQDHVFDILPLMFASQGTLGVVSEVILEAQFINSETDYLYVEFDNYDRARDVIDAAVALDPSMLNLCESEIMQVAESTGKVFGAIERPDGFEPKIALMIGFSEARRAGAKKVKRLMKKMPEEGVVAVASSKDSQDDFTQLMGVVETYLNTTSGGQRVPFIDGVYVPMSFLGEYFGAVKALGKRLKVNMPVYGSVITGVYNVRPEIDFGNLSDRQMMFKLMSEYAAIVSAMEGSFAGGAPEGRLKSIVVRKDMNEQLEDLYMHIKETFDPQGVLNPGVKAKIEVRDLVGGLRKDYREGAIKE